jgi:hypothetical protein
MKTLFLMLLIFPQVSHGFTLTISNRSYGNPAFQSALDTLADTLQTQFNSAIASASHQSDFLTAMGNANAMSARSYLSPGVIPADRNFFMNFGGSFGLALGAGSSLSNGITFPQNQLPPIGISAKTGVSVGVSAKKFPSFFKHGWTWADS